jgi:hypothetical protein
VFASTLRQSAQAHPLQKVPLAKQSQYSFRHWLFLQWQVRIGLQTLQNQKQHQTMHSGCFRHETSYEETLMMVMHEAVWCAVLCQQGTLS